MTITLDGQTFEQWMEDLKSKAVEEGINLDLQHYHYHSWFSHDYTPEDVINYLLQPNLDGC